MTIMGSLVDRVEVLSLFQQQPPGCRVWLILLTVLYQCVCVMSIGIMTGKRVNCLPVPTHL